MWALWLVLAAFGADRGVELSTDRQRPVALDRTQQITLDFGDTNLFDLSLYFADLMNKNLLVVNEEELKRRTVRIVGHDTMSVEEAWQAFLVTLKGNGLQVEESANLVRIVPAKDAMHGPMPIGEGAPIGHEGLVTQILALSNAQAGDVVSVVKPLLSPEAVVVAWAPGNRLIITDTAANVAKVAELVEGIDWAAPVSTVQRTQLRYADVEEVRAILAALYPTEATPAAPTPSATSRRSRRARTPEPTAPTTTTAGERARHIEQILSDPRTNSLIVLANPSGHAAVAEIVAELDVDADPDARKQLHVVPLKFAMADELLSVLTSLQSKNRTTERRPADDPEQDVALALDDDVRLAADPATNAIIVVASPAAFDAVADLVGDLDVVRGQVFIDAVFVELTHTGGREIGLEAQILPGDGTPGASLGLDPSGSVSALSVTSDVLSGLAAGVFGSAVEVVGPDGTALSVPRFGIALRALQTRKDIQVMGNPSLLTLDHNEAELTIGQRIPYPVNSQVTTVGTPIQTYERQDVGTSLVVTPHINSASLVTMDIALDVEEVEGSATESDLAGGPVTSNRSVQSRVMVETGQTIVIATSLGTRTTLTESKVPILGDIPLLGALFRGRKEESRDSQLMVFLTPTIVTSPADLLHIRMQKEAQRAEFVRRFQGRKGKEWLAELQRLLDPDAPEAEVVPLSRRERRREERQRRRRSN